MEFPRSNLESGTSVTCLEVAEYYFVMNILHVYKYARGVRVAGAKQNILTEVLVKNFAFSDFCRKVEFSVVGSGWLI